MCGTCSARVSGVWHLLGARVSGVWHLLGVSGVWHLRGTCAVQALMLTDIVVEATVMALLLALAVRAHQHAGSLDPAKLVELRG